MVLKKISYKNKVVFDYFEIWLDKNGDNDFWSFESVFDHSMVDRKEVKTKANCVSTQICPWCTRKYNLYKEVERTPESIDEEIESYKNEDPKDLDFCCGVEGCTNGLADYVDIPWEYFEIKED